MDRRKNLYLTFALLLSGSIFPEDVAGIFSFGKGGKGGGTGVNEMMAAGIITLLLSPHGSKDKGGGGGSRFHHPMYHGLSYRMSEPRHYLPSFSNYHPSLSFRHYSSYPTFTMQPHHYITPRYHQSLLHPPFSDVLPRHHIQLDGELQSSPESALLRNIFLDQPHVSSDYFPEMFEPYPRTSLSLGGNFQEHPMASLASADIFDHPHAASNPSTAFKDPYPPRRRLLLPRIMRHLFNRFMRRNGQ